MRIYIPMRRLTLIAFLCVFSVYGCSSNTDSNTISNSSNNNSNSSNRGNGTLLSGDRFGENPSIATSVVGNHVNVYVAWEEPAGQLLGQPTIVFRRSTDGGILFEDRQNLFTYNNPSGSHPVLAAVGEDVYLAWVETDQGESEIRFSVSHNSGQSFTSPIRVSDIGKTSDSPAIAASQSFVYFVWLELDSSDIRFRRYDNSKQDFDDSTNLSNDGTATVDPSVSTADGEVYVAWQDTLDNNSGGNDVEDILFARDPNAGQFPPLPAHQNLSSNLSNSTHPAVAADGQNVYVLWEDFSSTVNNSSILSFQRSTDGGVTFDPQDAIEITLAGVPANRPRMAADGGHVFIVWDNPVPNPDPGKQGSLQIVFAKSDDQGTSFNAPLNISQNPTSAKNPAVSGINGQAYVVWEGQFETSPQDFEQRIFFYKPS
jgi:hypothetical protein